MPNLSPESFGSFWYGRPVGVSTEDWKEGFAILVHPDTYMEEELILSKKDGDRIPEQWWLYLLLQAENTGEARVEEDAVHTTFRVMGYRRDGSRCEQRVYYGAEAPERGQKHQEGSEREKKLAQRRQDTWVKAVEYAKYVVRSMT